MVDVGRKEKELYGPPPGNKDRIIYPSLSLSGKDLKALAQLNFNEGVELQAVGKISGKHQWNDEPPEITLELHKIGIKRRSKISDAEKEALKQLK